MEFVAGQTLRALASEPVALDLVIAWASQIAQALAVAHAAGIVHRDIKPENIMVRDDGYVKVLDFGLAQLGPTSAVSPDAATAVATNPGTLLGTVRYMSPEQAHGDKVSAAADLFALGIVLYELTTGRHPMNASTLLELVRAIAVQPPTPPSLLVPTIPPEFERLLLRLLDKDARQRPAAKETASLLSQMSRAGPIGSTTGAPSARGLALPLVATPFIVVGREKERAAMRSAFQSADAKRGLLLCIAGEAGIGKTTLVEDLLAELAADHQPCRIARGRCSERLAGTEAYLPWLEALDALRRDEGRAQGRLLPQLGSEPVDRTMRRVAPTWYAQVAPLAGEDPSNAALIAALASASQERMKRELAVLLEELSRDQPIVLFSRTCTGRMSRRSIS